MDNGVTHAAGANEPQTPEPVTDVTRSWSHGLALLVIIMVGVAIRCANHGRVLGGAEIFFPDNDPYYHMWRVLAIMRDYPTVPYFDAMMNYPFGASIIWPPLFDFFIATLNMTLGMSPEDPRGVEVVSAFAIPIIGGLTAGAVYLLAKETVGQRYALAAAGVFILFPAHIWYSKLGFVDHHAPVTLIQVFMFALFMRLYARMGACAGAGLRGNLALLAAASCSMAVGMLTWNGFIFFVALLDMFLLAALLARGLRPESRLAELCWATHIPVVLMISPAIMATVQASGRSVTAIHLSWFHGGAIAAFGVVGLLFHLLRARPGLALARWPWNLAAAFAMTIAGFIAAAYTGALSEGMGWILTSDKFMANVLESQSFFIESGSFSMTGGLLMLTGLFPVALVGAGAMLAEQWKDRFADGRRLFLVFLTFALFVMLAKQRRFGADFGPAMAVVIAYLAVNLGSDGAANLAARGVGRRLASILVGAGMMALIVAASGPFLWSYIVRPQFTHAADDHYQRKNKFLIQLRDLLDSSGRSGDHGVMSFWDLGHKIQYITKMGVVSNNFGLHIGEDSFHDWSAFFLATSEEEGDRIMERRKARYVVSDFDIGALRTAALYMGRDPSGYYSVTTRPNGRQDHRLEQEFFKTLFARFTLFVGSEQVVNFSGGRLVVPPLEGYRLILDWGRKEQGGYPKAWERVAGARLILHGQPGGEARLVYTFVSGSAGERRYVRTVHLDKEGMGLARVPYSSERADLGHSSEYRIIYAGGERRLFVKERQVVEGETIHVDLQGLRSEE